MGQLAPVGGCCNYTIRGGKQHLFPIVNAHIIFNMFTLVFTLSCISLQFTVSRWCLNGLVICSDCQSSCERSTLSLCLMWHSRQGSRHLPVCYQGNTCSETIRTAVLATVWVALWGKISIMYDRRSNDYFTPLFPEPINQLYTAQYNNMTLTF